MIHYYSYQPRSAQAEGGTSRRSASHKHPLRTMSKRLLLLLLIFVLAVTTVTAGMYVYVTQVPMANTQSRTNILILGVDDRAELSDTIMLVSILDKGDKPEATITSIPRDMYVEVPGFGSHKVNAAHALGEQNDYPGGGPGLTSDTLERVLDVDIHYYAALDFAGMEAIVDSVGGVTVDVPSAIDDPYYPEEGYTGYDPFQIEAGVQEMDGETALKYARSRKTTDDFDRAFRQQQILLGVRDRLLGSGGIPRPWRTFSLLSSLETHIETDMSRLSQLQLAARLRHIKSQDTPRYVIDNTNFLTGAGSNGGNLAPPGGDYSQVQRFLADIFTDPGIDEYKSRY